MPLANSIRLSFVSTKIIFIYKTVQLILQVIMGLAPGCLCLSLITLLTLLIDGAFEGRTYSDLVRKSALFLTLASAGLCSAFIISRFQYY